MVCPSTTSPTLTHQSKLGHQFELTYNTSMKKLLSIFKFCYKFIFQFISYALIGFGIYKEKIEEKEKPE